MTQTIHLNTPSSLYSLLISLAECVHKMYKNRYSIFTHKPFKNKFSFPYHQSQQFQNRPYQFLRSSYPIPFALVDHQVPLRFHEDTMQEYNRFLLNAKQTYMQKLVPLVLFFVFTFFVVQSKGFFELLLHGFIVFLNNEFGS